MSGPVASQSPTGLPRQSDIPDSTAFLARDLSDGTTWVLDGSELDQRHSPFSTFKIPNLLIALQTGVEASLDATREWQPDRRPPVVWWPDSWRREHTLRSAFQNSVVWYFRDIALEVGSAHYQQVLRDWSYGNMVAPEGSDNFWVTGELQISVAEQVRFLSNLWQGRLSVSNAELAALSEAARSDERGTTVLHGKTGGGYGTRGAEGWYVGYLTRPDRAPVVFALHLNGSNWNSIRDVRKPLAERLLTDAGVWPVA